MWRWKGAVKRLSEPVLLSRVELYCYSSGTCTYVNWPYPHRLDWFSRLFFQPLFPIQQGLGSYRALCALCVFFYLYFQWLHKGHDMRLPPKIPRKDYFLDSVVFSSVAFREALGCHRSLGTQRRAGKTHVKIYSHWAWLQASQLAAIWQITFNRSYCCLCILMSI